MISPFIFTKIQIQQIAFSNRDFIQREKIAKIFNCQHDINSTSISVRIFIKFFEICNKYPFSIGATIRGQDLLHISKKDRKSTRLNSSHVSISYAVFCLKKKKTNNHNSM